MNRDLGLTATQFGWGAGIMFAGYCLFEVPSNLALYRWRAALACPHHDHVGLMAAATALATGPTSFTRSGCCSASAKPDSFRA